MRKVGPLELQFCYDDYLFQFMGHSNAVENLYREVELVAKTNFTTILEGETGSGKDVTARAIHYYSNRKDAPFVAMDCGAIPDALFESELYGYVRGAFTGAVSKKEGHFELAAGGTLFLDEITNLKLDIQGKLLRALEDKQIRPLGSKKPYSVDTRIIVSTNVDLLDEVHKGNFRRDLYHRLNEYSIYIPPLRNRREDIPYLINLFVHEANRELGKSVKGATGKALELLAAYDYPGNVRELRNMVRKAVLMSDKMIGPECFPNLTRYRRSSLDGLDLEKALKEGVPLKEVVAQATKKLEKEAVELALREVGYNKTMAARLLKIDRKTLYKKMGAGGCE